MEKSIVLNDTTSEIVKVLPKNLLEPAIIISKIMGLESVDAYAIELIRRDLISYQLGDGIVKEFKAYLEQFVSKEDGDYERNTF